MSDWISVKERMPKPRTRALVCTSNGYIQVSYWNGGGHAWACDREGVSVLYWMPLPDPPEES